MTSLFAESHNMVAILEKSDAAQGFEQIIDFLSGSYIQHALTVNPHVYISCIKQFWNTAVVKRSGDVTRLQALVDNKRIVITKEVVHEILQLDDAEAIYKADLLQGILLLLMEVLYSYASTLFECKQASWNEFSSAMASALICLSTDGVVQEFVTKEIADDVAQPTSPLPPSTIIPSTPPHQSPSPPSQQATEGLETANTAQQLEILKLKARVKKLERLNKVKSSKLRCLKKVGTSQHVESSEDIENVFKQGRINVDMDEGIELVVNQEKNAEVKGRHADTQAEIYNIDLDHSSKVLSMQEDTEVQEAVEVVTTAKLKTKVVTADATQVAAASAPILTTKPAVKPKVLKIAAAAPAVSTRKRKGVVIRDPKEELHTKTPAETPTVKDKGKGILIEDPKPMKKKDQYIKRYHGFKKKPQSESKARKNMISYLRNTKGFKMEFFKGLKYDDILLIFQARFDANLKFLFKTREEIKKEDEEIIKSINETPAQKATKRRRLNEQAKEDEALRKQLEVVVDEDDDVFLEATPIGRKVPVVNYEIVMINNKPRFSTSKPANFTDDYLLSTLKTMFEKTYGQDVIWRSQQTEYGQALVKS
nr:hypothetical protein [Tanacetum cinerariifolium]